MQLRSLEIFCDVAKLRSFSKAADARGVSQSAVSQTVQHLEESLGTQLIDRSSRPLSLTRAGQTYFRGLQSVLAKYHQLEREVITAGHRVSGPLHVAAIYSVGLSYLPDAKEEFARVYPEVDVRVDYGRNEDVIERLLGGEVELGLVSFPKSTKQIVAVPWQKEPMRLVCSAKHPLAKRNEVSLSDLDGLEMVGFDSSLELRRSIDQHLKRAGVRVDFRTEFDNADSIVRAIQANDGAGFLPEAAVRRETAAGALRVVACRGLSMIRPLGIIFRRSGRPSRAGHEFGSLLLGRPLDPERDKKSKPGEAKPDVSDAAIETGTSVIA
ncbi:LysR family transcriptional regulator [Roseiconus nitratireducens]|uniref:LysR family transcriptional regulator n=1 Tax=Roseiconus nitratireducens TaxID=2605748 RepID=A0A5M6DII0_9BACT|nr:LysR family transcriptional regulator [Roseiconus nitratireducens]KAA5546040.1 LysR family transcriptional regulator [Roseiconus nitratireducens]